MLLNKLWHQFKRVDNDVFHRIDSSLSSFKQSIENIDNEMKELKQNLQAAQTILNVTEDSHKTALQSALDKHCMASQHLSTGDIENSKLCLKQQVFEEEKSQYYLMQSYALKQNITKIKEKMEIVNNKRDMLKHTLQLLEAHHLIEKSELLVIKLANDLKIIEKSNEFRALSTASSINTLNDQIYKKLETNISDEDVCERLKALRANQAIKSINKYPLSG